MASGTSFGCVIHIYPQTEGGKHAERSATQGIVVSQVFTLVLFFDSSSKFQSPFAKVAKTGKRRPVSGSLLVNKGQAPLSNHVSADFSLAHTLPVQAAGSRPRRLNLQKTRPSACPCRPPGQSGVCKTRRSTRQHHTAKANGLLCTEAPFLIRSTHRHVWYSNACKRVQALLHA